MSTGSNLLLALKRNPNTWGSGDAVLCGANDQIEVESEALAPDVTLIEDVGLTGQATQLPGHLGNRIVANSFGPCPLYYRGLGLPVAMGMGEEVAPAQLGGTTAYEHALRMKASHAGLNNTLALAGVDHPAVREIPHVKVDGFTFDFQSNALGKLTVPIVGSDMYPNETPDDDLVVTPVTPANGALTIAAQPNPPSKLTVLVVDGDASITEFIIDFYGEDDSGRFITERYQLSVDGLTWESAKRWSNVSQATASGLAGTATGDTVQVGVQAGVNNLSTFSGISLPSTADRIGVAFAQLRLWINDQDGSDFVDATDERFPTSVRITLTNGLSQNYSTRFGNRPDEPLVAGNFLRVEVGINFHTWDAASNPLFRDRLMVKRQKVKVSCQGPIAAGMGSNPLEWSFFLNNVQFGQGSPNAGGPGPISFDLTGMAHRTLSSPTGLPSWANTQPLSIREVNLRTTAYLS